MPVSNTPPGDPTPEHSTPEHRTPAIPVLFIEQGDRVLEFATTVENGRDVRIVAVRDSHSREQLYDKALLPPASVVDEALQLELWAYENQQVFTDLRVSR